MRKTLLPVVVGLLAVVLACVGYLLSPAGRSRAARERDLTQLQAQLADKHQEVLPTRGMDGKLKKASDDITGFYQDRFPAQYSAVSEQLGKLASTSGVQITGIKYEDKDTPVEGLRKLNVELALSGSYLQEVKFINALERDKMFFTVKSLQLSNEQQSSNVKLALKTQTFLRNRV